MSDLSPLTSGEVLELAGIMLRNMALAHKKEVIVIASASEPYFSVSCGEFASDKNNLLMAVVDLAATLIMEQTRQQLKERKGYANETGNHQPSRTE